MRIANNLQAVNTHRQLGITGGYQTKSMEKLSSGLKINRAGDDAAGLSISEKMRNQIRGLSQASANSQDAISLIQTAEGALTETHNILKRMRELVVKAGNKGTMSTEDFSAIDDEIQELNAELSGIAQRTEFNGKALLDGKYSGTFQIGANKTQTMDLAITASGTSTSKVALGATGLKVNDITINSGTDINATLGKVDEAIKTVSSVRSKLGANQNRLEYTIKNLDNAAENLQAAESRIRDTDMAKEMVEFTKQNILQQAAQAMLAQANASPQGVLQLLR
ncbi:flagellin [Proteiniborus ethanoligenes]|uniref:Flagellin n=1 Tax=Proteiniborus ethanoligenes TaxID=415015 RepID=A0A1H3S461_9FIRM|nr:flagellin Hag [Proteiniborus ethanoligenes]SDZ32873.1 flagellin [Proteiniborus ethanoligenes]